MMLLDSENSERLDVLIYLPLRLYPTSFLRAYEADVIGWKMSKIVVYI